MILRPLGPGARTVSAVGYGGMHLSIQDRPPEADALRVLTAVLEAGATLIDTQTPTASTSVRRDTTSG